MVLNFQDTFEVTESYCSLSQPKQEREYASLNQNKKENAYRLSKRAPPWAMPYIFSGAHQLNQQERSG